MLGRFVAVLDGGVVRIQRLDGRHVRVAIDRLSTLDQRFVRDLHQTLAMSW